MNDYRRFHLKVLLAVYFGTLSICLLIGFAFDHW